MEIADGFVINKADRKGVEETRRDLELMLDLSELGEWRPPIVATVAAKEEGIDALWRAIEDHRAYAERAGILEQRRGRRLQEELREIVVQRPRRRGPRAVLGGRVRPSHGRQCSPVAVDPLERADRSMLERIGS